MSQTPRETILSLHHSDIPALTKELAEQYHQMFCQQIEEGITAALEEMGHDEADHDLIVPSFKLWLHRSLASANLKAAQGWDEIFWANVNERYDAGGEV